MADRVVTADGPAGRLFACVSPGARFTEAKVADSRLSAFLRPFPDEAAAKAALTSAGGENLKEEGKR
jgi:hypothetical protein